MRILFKTLTLLALFSAGGVICSEQPDATTAVKALVESEKSFARTCGEHGIRDSFLQYFAADAVIFAPEPTNGRAFYAKYDDKGRHLNWQPAFAAISSSGEVGLTTGPWELKKSAADPTPLAFGQFVSVWKKQPDGSWKVIVDVGIDHPSPAASRDEVQFSLPNSPPNNVSEFAKAEERFTKALAVNAGAGLIDSASDEIRVLRDQNLPAVGKEAAELILNSEPGKMTRKIGGGATSAANDFAWRYGPYANDRGNSVEIGHYLTIWQIDRSGDWKIILDLQKKAPNPEKK
jgi:ketosteroid isomerase-like protein